MKNILSICLICVIAFSCEKSAPVIYNDGILGKWVLSEYYVNPGVGGQNEWQTPDDSFGHTLEFKSNGDFITNAGLYYDATAYEIPDSTYIKFLNASQQVNGSLEYFYSLEENNSVLIISPMCFEGCAYKYKAVE